MNLKSKLGRFFQQCIKEYRSINEVAVPTNPIGATNLSSNNVGSVSLRFYRAAGGGMVVNSNRYDPIKDRGYDNLYIVEEGKDLAEEISKILMLENLR